MRCDARDPAPGLHKVALASTPRGAAESVDGGNSRPRWLATRHGADVGVVNTRPIPAANRTARPTRQLSQAVRGPAASTVPVSDTRCVGLFDVLRVVATTAIVASALVFGIGLLGSRLVDLDAGRATSRVESVVAQTMDLIAASTFEEIERLHGTALPATACGGAPTWRIEFAVSSQSTGCRVDATVVNTETRAALRQFVAWRGRS